MHNRPVRIIERGSGEPTLLIHGTAADAMTWSYQLVSIKRGLRMIAYDRSAGVHRADLGDGGERLRPRRRVGRAERRW